MDLCESFLFTCAIGGLIYGAYLLALWSVNKGAGR